MANIPATVAGLDAELREIFGERLESLVVYGEAADGSPVTTMAIVASVAADDLQRCAQRAAGWHDAGLATPLLLASHEFERSLDAFPFEFGAIIADHAVVSGRNPFERVTVDAADLRRACEVRARSHLLHLREGFIETRGRSDAIADLVVHSGPSFAALLKSVERLAGDRRPPIAPEVAALAGTAKMIGSGDAVRIFPAYLDAIDALVRFVDRWGDAR